MTLTIRRRWLFHAVNIFAKVIYPQFIVGVAMATFYPEKLTPYLRVLCGLALVPLFFLRPRVEHVAEPDRRPIRPPLRSGALLYRTIIETTIDGPPPTVGQSASGRIQVRVR